MQMSYLAADIRKQGSSRNADRAEIQRNVKDEVIGMSMRALKKRERVAHMLEYIEHQKHIVAGCIQRVEISGMEFDTWVFLPIGIKTQRDVVADEACVTEVVAKLVKNSAGPTANVADRCGANVITLEDVDDLGCFPRRVRSMHLGIIFNVSAALIPRFDCHRSLPFCSRSPPAYTIHRKERSVIRFDGYAHGEVIEVLKGAQVFRANRPEIKAILGISYARIKHVPRSP